MRSGPSQINLEVSKTRERAVGDFFIALMPYRLCGVVAFYNASRWCFVEAFSPDPTDTEPFA